MENSNDKTEVWTIRDALDGRCSTTQLGQRRSSEAVPPPPRSGPSMEQVILDITEAYQRKGGYTFLMSKPALMRRALALTVKQIKLQAEPATIIEFRPPSAQG